MTNSYKGGNKVIDLGDEKKIIDLDRGNLYLGEGKGEVFLHPEELKWFYYNFASKLEPTLKPKKDLEGIGELRYDNGRLNLIDASGNSYDITKEAKDIGFDFYRYISQLGLERTGLGGGEFNEDNYSEEKEGSQDKHKTLKKIGAIVGTSIIGAGIVFGAGLIGGQDQNNLENIVYENMEKINSTLHEKEFSYCSDTLTDNINLHEVVPYNYKITGYGSLGIYITIDDNEIPNDVKTFKALVELGYNLENNEEIVPQMNCYKFLVGEKENYPIDITLPILNHPNDVIYPSELIKTKSGDCEDYSLLYAKYYNSYNIPAFVVIANGHAVAAVGDIPSNPNELKKNIKKKKSFIIGSSEYLNKNKFFDFSTTTKLACTKDILNELEAKYSSANIRAIISKENLWVKEDSYYFNVSEFEYLDKEYAKKAANYLKMNISEEQIDKMSNEYYELYKNLAEEAINVQKDNNIEFYQEIRNVLNNPYEDKAVENLFNKTVK